MCNTREYRWLFVGGELVFFQFDTFLALLFVLTQKVTKRSRPSKCFHPQALHAPRWTVNLSAWYFIIDYWEYPQRQIAVGENALLQCGVSKVAHSFAQK